MFELFEHTADLGLRVRAADLDTLLVEAAQALFSAVLAEPQTVEPKQRVEVRLADDDRELLLFDWLKTLLYHWDAEHLLFSKFEAKVSGDALAASAWGEPYDPERHVLDHEVKAITYHGLRVERVGDQWEAEVIVDI